MGFSTYSRVQLLSDTYASEGAPSGSIGYIIEVHPGDRYEVEFSDPKTGISYAQIVAPERELIAATEPPL